MQKKTLINEVRRKVDLLESKYEVIVRDLEFSRGFLSMLERELTEDDISQGKSTHAEHVGTIVADVLSRNPDMHRKDILKAILNRGIHIGYDDNSQKQLAMLSSILSRDTRFKPVSGKNGYWSLKTNTSLELLESVNGTDDPELLMGEIDRAGEEQ